MIASIRPPCDPEKVWNLCEPAMTVVPSFLVTGILATIVGIIVYSQFGHTLAVADVSLKTRPRIDGYKALVLGTGVRGGLPSGRKKSSMDVSIADPR
jgi:hypothetical protein